MLFTQPAFLVFFGVVFALHWSLRANGARKLLLLVASYVFYGFWDERFLGLIVLSTLVDHVAALRMERPGARRGRWLFLSVFVNLTMLGFFKYWGFFVDSAASLLAQLGVEARLPTLEVVLPVGISFFTFQTMSYSLDVYRRKIAPTRSLLDVATFVAFFPQLVAGPIVRAAEFLPQLRSTRTLRTVDLRGALVLFLIGFLKKRAVADNLAQVVDAYFEAPETFDATSAWLATLAYAVQIYCDFSGYSDMAIACAALLGYRLVLNFAYPYLAGNPTEFWRRWHISLSSWLRDYLYVPLGGNRGGRLFVARNLMLTMLLGGLWHGAAWTFVAWGGLHGLALIVHRAWQRLGERNPLRLALRPVAPLLLGWFVCLCWIFFRADGFPQALQVARAFVTFQAPGVARLDPALFLALPVLLAAHVVAARGWLHGWWRRLSLVPFAVLYGAAWALVLPLVPVGFTPFLYFQF